MGSYTFGYSVFEEVGCFVPKLIVIIRIEKKHGGIGIKSMPPLLINDQIKNDNPYIKI